MWVGGVQPQSPLLRRSCGHLWGHQLLQSPPQQLEPPDRVGQIPRGTPCLVPGSTGSGLSQEAKDVGCRETVLPWASLFFPFFSQALNLNKHTHSSSHALYS